MLGNKIASSSYDTNPPTNLDKICAGEPSCTGIKNKGALIIPDVNNANEDVATAASYPGEFPGEEVVDALGFSKQRTHMIETPGTFLETPTAPVITVSAAASISATWFVGLTLWAMIRPMLRSWTH